MPLLRFDDPLPARPARVLVAGTSGSGKTTFAALIARVLGVPHVEIDALFHGPGWTPRAEFRPDVERLSEQPTWVTEWQYGEVRALLAERADLLVWLDLPRRTVMRQVVSRTLSRRLRRQRLWHGNVEPPLWTVLRDDEHVVRWAWTSHPRTQERVLQLVRDRPALPVVRLGDHEQASLWLTGSLAASTRAGR